MNVLHTLHRWAGGVFGLLFVVLGLSGAVLVHRDLWIGVPTGADVGAPPNHAAVARMMTEIGVQPRSLSFPTGDFALTEIALHDGGGAYADSSGAIVARWSSRWERPELWLFDLHHKLFLGETGETIVGVAGVLGFFFVVSGCVLWWRTRRTFRLRLMPEKLTRPEILRHHRNFGVVMAPLLALSFITGALLIFRPLTTITFGPGAPAAIAAAVKPPPAERADLAADFDWANLIVTAQARFPDGKLGALVLPKGDAGLVTLRMRRPGEWLPKGRTTMWFAADTGRLVAARDGTALPAQARAFNMVYPLHAAEVGGLAYRLAMTAAGLGLSLLGGLTMWTFWFKRARPRAESRPLSARRIQSAETVVLSQSHDRHASLPRHRLLRLRRRPF